VHVKNNPGAPVGKNVVKARCDEEWAAVELMREIREHGGFLLVRGSSVRVFTFEGSRPLAQELLARAAGMRKTLVALVAGEVTEQR